MAKLISYYYDKLNIAKASLQELHSYVVDEDNRYSYQDNFETLKGDILSGSKVAKWRLWIWLFAFGSWLIDSLFDQHKAEVKELIDAKTPHRPRWYAEETKKYQQGYALIWSNNQFSYERIDEDAKIVKYAAASEKSGKVVIKCAKVSNGVKVPLTAPEKAGLIEFWKQWKDAGVKVEISSHPADELKIDITIVRDRLVLTGSNALIRDNSIHPIQDAIDEYSNNLEFDGKIILSDLQQKIKDAEGVVDVKINSASWRPNGGNLVPVNMSVDTVAGYFIITQDSSYDYIDNVNVTLHD